MNTTSERLRRLRGNKTPEEVAAAIGVSMSAYVKYERGERVPRDAVKKKIADYYNRTVQYIFFNN